MLCGHQPRTSISVNGALIATNTTLGTFTPTYPLTGRWGTMTALGFFAPTNNYNGFNGKIDEFRIYNRALSAGEISTLYAVALPVQLTSFTAVKTGADVLLQWQTGNERNSSHYTVQRSADGINFNTIGRVDATGTAGSSSYRYIDNTVNAVTTGKTIYYRLLQTDKNGRTELSSIVSVKQDAAAALLTLMQNPAVNDLRIQLSVKQHEPVQLHITNAAGKTVVTKQLALNAGQTFTVLPVQALAAGTYYITVTAAAHKQTLAFIKQ